MISFDWPTLINFESYMSNLGGISDYLPEMKALLSTWGLELDHWQQAAYSAITNQFSRMADGFGAEDPQGIYDEFELPPDPRLIPNKWQHAQDRYTKIGLCRMLALCGHTAVRIYNNGGYFDSSAILANDAIYKGNFNAIPGGAATDLSHRYIDIGITNQAYQVMIYDMFDSTMKTTIAGFVVGKSLGRNSDGKPGWAHTPKGDELLIKQICEYHEALGEAMLEVFYCYPRTDTGQSISNWDGEPNSSNDRISVSAVNVGIWETSWIGTG